MTAKVVNVDIFLIQLIRSIEKWYDEHYMDKMSSKKNEHINEISNYYIPSRFREAKNLCEEREKFLSEIHTVVWEKKRMSI